MSELLEHTSHIEDRLVELDRAITQIAREDDRSLRLLQLRGLARPRRVPWLPVSGMGTTSEMAAKWSHGSD